MYWWKKQTITWINSWLLFGLDWASSVDTICRGFLRSPYLFFLHLSSYPYWIHIKHVLQADTLQARAFMYRCLLKKDINELEFIFGFFTRNFKPLKAYSYRGNVVVVANTIFHFSNLPRSMSYFQIFFGIASLSYSMK